MPGYAQPRVDEGGIPPVRLAEGAREALRRRRRQDEMDMVRHQHVGPDRHGGLISSFTQQVAIEPIIVIAEEHALAPIAALRDVMRQVRNDVAGDAGHLRPQDWAGEASYEQSGNKASVTVIPPRRGEEVARNP